MPPPPHKGAKFHFQPDFSLKQNLFQLAALLLILPFLISGSGLSLTASPSGRVLTPLQMKSRHFLPPWLRLRPYLLHESVSDQLSLGSLFSLHSISALLQNLTCNPYRLPPKLFHTVAWCSPNQIIIQEPNRVLGIQQTYNKCL